MIQVLQATERISLLVKVRKGCLPAFPSGRQVVGASVGLVWSRTRPRKDDGCMRRFCFHQGWIDVAPIRLMIRESLLFRFNSFINIGSTSSKRAKKSSRESGGVTPEIRQKISNVQCP